MFIHIVVNNEKEIVGCWSSETDALKQSRSNDGSKITKIKLNTQKVLSESMNKTNKFIDPSLFNSWKHKYNQSR
mgnify:FL=1|tara:strand:+ start:82 stop:303 length:222 start_codon:yes stop_codon:yes gene_type:complete